MGPRVVSADRYATNRSSLHRQKQAVVAGCSPGLNFMHGTKKLSGGRILEHQSAALVDVRSCRTDLVLDAIERAWAKAKKDRVVERLSGPQMPGRVSEVGRGEEPVRADLFLDAEI